MIKRYFSNNFINYLLLFSAGIIWGSQYLLTKIVLTGFAPTALAFIRIGLGALFLTIFLFLKKHFFAQKKEEDELSLPLLVKAPYFLLIGFLEATTPILLVSFSLSRLPSSLIAILITTTPFFTILLEKILLHHPLTFKKLLSLFFGMTGVLVLFWPTLKKELIDFHFFNLLFLIAPLVAAGCFSFAMILMKEKITPYYSSFKSAQGILLGAALSLAPYFLGHLLFSSTPMIHNPSLSAWIGLISLAFFCSATAYTLFTLLVKRAGATFASACNYLIPLVGVSLGVSLGGEKLTLSLIGALGLILISLFCLKGPSLRGIKKEEES